MHVNRDSDGGGDVERESIGIKDRSDCSSSEDMDL